jgi:hypothetical protein
MPGFSIYSGESKSQEDLKNLLKEYENTTTLEIGGEQKDFLDKINDYKPRSNGDISFIYQSDGSVPYIYHGEQKYYMTTYYIDVRIITREKLYFLIQRNRFDKADLISSKLSRRIYESLKEILPYEISSDLIKVIENKDSLTIRKVYFSGVNARDRSIGLIGTLGRKQGEGKHDYSEVHNTFKDGEKSFSEFVSYSRGARVLISGKKSSLTLMRLGNNTPSLDDAEFYIKEYILPAVASTSISQIGTN